MKLLKDILYKAGTEQVVGNTDIPITQLTFDSRNVPDGSLFIAIKGTKSDGHKFIEQVIKSSAVAIVCEELPKVLVDNITYIKVKVKKALTER